MGEKWGSKNRRNAFKFLPGNKNDTCNTSGKSEFIWFNSYYRNIGQKRNSDTKSLKNSISQRRIRLLDSLGAWVSCAHSKEDSLYPAISRVETLDRLLFFNLHFWRNCYVTNIASDNRNHFVKCSTTQSLNSLSILRINFSTGAVYQHSVQQTDRHLKNKSVSFRFTGRKHLWTRRESTPAAF